MANLNDEDEDESMYLEPKRGSMEEEIGKVISGLAAAEEDEEASPSPSPGAPSPAPKPAAAPVPTPTAVTSTGPVFGECCKRMKSELAEQTNILKWNDHKGSNIIVFAHNLNKILCCPWCGVKIP